MSGRLPVAAALLILSIPQWSDRSFGEEPSDAKPEDQPKRKVLVTISEETTWITEPLTEEGYVDYMEALNQRLSKDVIPETNAAVPLFEALGPAAVEEVVREEFFRRLGAPVPAEQGEYFVSLDAFAAAKGLEDFGVPHEALIEATKRPWRGEDQPLLRDWLEANAGPLERIERAIQRPVMYLPLVAAPDESGETAFRVLSSVHPGIGAFREIARALTARAMLRLGGGHLGDAQSDLLAVHRLARHAAVGPHLIDRLVAIAIEGTALEGDAALAVHGNLSAEDAAQYAAKLRALAPLPPIVEALEVGERFTFLDMTQDLARLGIDRLNALGGAGGEGDGGILSRIPTGAVINYDIALRKGNDFFDKMSAAMRETDPDKRRALFDKVEEELQAAREEVGDAGSIALQILGGHPPKDVLGRYVAGILLNLLLPAFSASQAAEQQILMRQELAQVAFALAGYRAERGRYPEELSDLVPKSIAAIPPDRFSGEALQYVRTGEGYRVYSVGRNGVDDGGVDQREDPSKDDLVISTPDSVSDAR